MNPDNQPTHNSHYWRNLAIAVTAILSCGVAIISVVYIQNERTPGELLRYAEQYLIDYPELEAAVSPMLTSLRSNIEKPITEPVAARDKGQQAVSGNPPPQPIGTVKITDAVGIEKAIANAQPGQVLEIAPGTYPLSRTIQITKPGTASLPITLRAREPGSVIIRSSALEGFRVLAPYWIFENLVIQGKCLEDSECEHAFHVAGSASNTVIRNNRLEDFNAHIKVNGLKDTWPDNGLIQYNTLTNHRKRDTANPVTPIDIVGASGWVVADNHISHFVKHRGDRISYGIFMKGGGSDGRIERNLVVCTNKDISQAGQRVGISFGGGGSEPTICRDKRCSTEHTAGIIVDNAITHCNDFGIYINRSNQTTITGNRLINTYGIDIRFETSSARIDKNTVEGIIRSRDGAVLDLGNNLLQ